MNFCKREKVLTDVLCRVFHDFSSGGPNIGNPSKGEYEGISEICNYLQISHILRCAINKSDVDSDARKLFFRKFRNFSAPGLQVRKSHISRDTGHF